MVLLPAFRLTVVLIVPTVSQLPVPGKLNVTGDPPLTRSCAERVAAPFR